MKILLVNWQDRDNPQGGGAEIHLHEIFGRIASNGHRVDLLASGWKGAAAMSRDSFLAAIPSCRAIPASWAVNA